LLLKEQQTDSQLLRPKIEGPPSFRKERFYTPLHPKVLLQQQVVQTKDIHRKVQGTHKILSADDRAPRT